MGTFEKNRNSMNRHRARKDRYTLRKHLNSAMPKEHKSGKVGYVYIFDIGSGLYKVGMAGDWQSRLRDLGASNPNVKMVIAIRVSDARKCESHLHKSFKKVHYQRELFHLTHDHIQYAENYLNENPVSSTTPVQPTNPRVAPSGWISRRKEEIDSISTTK